MNALPQSEPGRGHGVHPAHRGSIFLEDGKVISQETWPGEQFVLRVSAPKCAARALPGSFVHLTCDPDVPMRRPLSMMRSNTGAASDTDWPMTVSTSALAVCCSSASFVSLNRRVFCIAITAWSAKACSSAISLSLKGSGRAR